MKRADLNSELKSLAYERLKIIGLILLLCFVIIKFSSLDSIYLYSIFLLLIPLDNLIWSGRFCCKNCNKSLWAYTTRNPKPRKLKLLSDISMCPHCGEEILD
jgi:hypothetical protein